LAPQEVSPPPSPRRYWTRRGIAEWLGARLAEDMPTLVGIDHGFSFPQHDAYTVAAWLRQADLDGQLGRFLNPDLTPPQRAVAGVEGWILGVA
jgi:hypothetical protein